MAIERSGNELAFLIGVAELEELLSDLAFGPEVFFEPEAVSIWLPELALYGRGQSFEEAMEDLVDEVRDYVDEYLSEAPLYRRAPGRAEQFPFVIKALVADASDRLSETLLAKHEPVAAA